jgi:hypothetical protein
MLVVKVRRDEQPELVIELGRSGERSFARRSDDPSLMELDSGEVDGIVEALGAL